MSILTLSFLPSPPCLPCSPSPIAALLYPHTQSHLNCLLHTVHNCPCFPGYWLLTSYLTMWGRYKGGALSQAGNSFCSQVIENTRDNINIGLACTEILDGWLGLTRSDMTWDGVFVRTTQGSNLIVCLWKYAWWKGINLSLLCISIYRAAQYVVLGEKPPPHIKG